MNVRFDGHTYNFVDKMQTLNNITFDVSKAQEWKDNGIWSEEGELARLFLSMQARPAKQIVMDGRTIIIPAVQPIINENDTDSKILKRLIRESKQPNPTIRTLGRIGKDL